MRSPIRLTLGVLVLAVLAAPSAHADDTAFFSQSVPPNVLLVLDNSYSMREIMYHPEWDVSKSTCAIFDRIAPDNDSDPEDWDSGTGNKTDQAGRKTPYNCDPKTNHCRFQISDGTSGFVQTGTVTCENGSTKKSGYITRTFCGRTRNLYVDGLSACAGGNTWHSEVYVEWFFSPDADPYFLGNESNASTDPLMVDANDNGIDFITNTTYPLFKLTRLPAVKRIAKDVIYRVNSNCGQGGGFPCPTGSSDRVRFGIATFDKNSGAPGGYVVAEVDDYSSNATSLDSAILKIKNNASTPLAETLFKTYTYFMSRDSSDRPFGKDNSTRFPEYKYKLSDGANSSSAPGDPLVCPGGQPCECQKNFVILVTDGQPNRDDFSTSGSGNTNTSGRTLGFDDFEDKLVGDYNADGQVEEPSGTSGWLYLDDLAKFMHENDFRLDLDDPQVIDVYTVGFATPADANNLLSDAAREGGGSFFASSQSGEMTAKLLDVIHEIIEKSQSFTAATVPAVRTSADDSFYVSTFTPSDKSGFWEGHLNAWTLTTDGRILDKGGLCALDEDPPCREGAFLPAAEPWWDAAEEIPTESSRQLFTVVPGTPGKVPFKHTLLTSGPSNQVDAADLGLAFPPPVAYPGSAATTAEQLAAEVVANVRGCEFGTGANGVACVPRTSTLGDIFHSSPVVVPAPSAFLDEESYQAFATNFSTRDRVIMAGANDGFLHLFNAGVWQTSTTPTGPAEPPGYDTGTGVEVAGFMPYTARQNAKELAVDSGARDFYFVDGSPTVADAWIHSSGDGRQASKASDGSEWKTVLVGGMRQGGRQYYALDVTDPAAASYPDYMWEFPLESDWVGQPSITDYMGQTWSEPVITRIRVKVDVGGGFDDNGGQGYERWVAIFGAGYDVVSDPNEAGYDPAAKAGRAIIVLDLKSGRILARKKFDPLASDGQQEMLYGFPSTPAVFDLDFDGFADVIYIGDLGGQVWKWVITDLAEDVANGSGNESQPGWTFKKYFEAPVYDNGSQIFYKSFFHAPAATYRNGKLWLAFGTEERTNLPFAGFAGTPAENNRFYAVTDLDPLERMSPALATLNEGDLLQITLDGSCQDVTGYRGYYFLAEDGEKFVTQVDIFFYWVFVASYKPTSTTGPCEAGGEAFLYAFKIYCGEGLFSDSGGNPTSRVDLDEGSLPSDPKVSVGPSGSDVIIIQKARVKSKATGIGIDDRTGQAYWRQME